MGTAPEGGDASPKVAVEKPAAEAVGGSPAAPVAVPPVIPAPAPASLWKYLPVPEDPDKHDEYDQKCLKSPEGYSIIGARVRGKKHKHEGSNCDDWFEVATSGAWSIIAVSDGAGSKKFSRVGSEAASKAAVKCLSEGLRDHQLTSRVTWSNDTFTRDPANQFREPDLEFIQAKLHEAMERAYQAVLAAAHERDNSKAHYVVLGNRDLTPDDLSATLLLAVHTTVAYGGSKYSFAMACQVGDGMTAAVSRAGSLFLLGEADGGAFSGETQFLTAHKNLSQENLRHKTFAFFSPLAALVVMTDGVADDYFPNDPELLRLYADLILNKMIPAQAPAKDAPTTDISTEVDRITGAGTQKVVLWSATKLAQGLKIDSITKKGDEGRSMLNVPPALLAAGGLGRSPLEGIETPEQRLLVWLDSYHVRGSFDDRTLVVLFPAAE